MRTPAGLHIGRRDENLQVGIGAQRFEIDEPLDQILERIDVERIDVIGREIARHRVEPGLHRRAFERRERQQPLHDGALQGRQAAAGGGRAPELGEPLLRLLAAAACKAVGQHHGIHRARRRAGNALDGEPVVAQKLFEHAPGEGAVRAAALQREIDALGLAARRFAPARGRATATRVFLSCGEAWTLAHAAVQPPSIERLAPVIDFAAIGAEVDGKARDLVDGDEFLGRLRRQAARRA